MNRNDFSSGKKTWIIACAKCDKYKGQCVCREDNVRVFSGMLDQIQITNLQEPGGMAFGVVNRNPNGVIRSTFNVQNALGVSMGVVHDNDSRERVEDEQ